MAMTADPSTNNRSPRSSGDGVTSPKSRRRSLPSPWAQVVRGEPEDVPLSPSSPPSIAAKFSDNSGLKGQSASPRSNSAAVVTQLESSDGSNGNVDRPSKPAWNKPLNGVVEVSPVMGAASWPALSESTRPSPKSDSSKPISDGSVSISQGPVIPHSPKKQAKTNARPKFTPNHTQPVRQRSFKRGSGTGGGSAQRGFSGPPPPPPPLPPPPLPPPFPVFGITYGNMVPALPDSSVREPPYKGNNWETRPIGGVGSQLHAVNDHSLQRNSSRRGNFGPRPRGDGLHHNGYGGRQDHDREWNSPRSSMARDVHIPHQMVPPPRVFMRPPPPGNPPFITPQHVRPFGNPMGFDMASPFLYVPPFPPDSFRGVPFVAHAPPQPVLFPVMDTPLPTLIINQIDYYFSEANLVKDNFLRSNMDDQGWVPITLIASFPRVQHLTNNIPLILDSLRASTVVEVQDDKVRCNEWRKWIPSSGQFPTDSGSQSPSGSTDNMLATSLSKVALDEVTTNAKSDAHTDLVADGFSSEGLSG